jgi:hypothetical protein
VPPSEGIGKMTPRPTYVVVNNFHVGIVPLSSSGIALSSWFNQAHLCGVSPGSDRMSSQKSGRWVFSSTPVPGYFSFVGLNVV